VRFTHGLAIRAVASRAGCRNLTDRVHYRFSAPTESVFSPPARITSLRTTAPPRPRRWAKNALCYADLRIMPRRCRSRGQVRRVSARHVGIIGLTEQAVVVPGSQSNGTGILGEACGRSARGSLAAVTLPDYRGDFRSWGRTGRARCGGTIHACDPTRTSGVAAQQPVLP